jgi:hypothetical protein
MSKSTTLEIGRESLIECFVSASVAPEYSRKTQAMKMIHYILV